MADKFHFIQQTAERSLTAERSRFLHSIAVVYDVSDGGADGDVAGDVVDVVVVFLFSLSWVSVVEIAIFIDLVVVVVVVVVVASSHTLALNSTVKLGTSELLT